MVFSMLIPASNGLGEVYATSTSGNTIDRSSPNVITDDDRADADAQLKAHMDSILKRTNPDEYTLKKLNDTFYSAVYYIANTEMSVSELWAYVGEMKAKLDAVVPDVSVTKPTTEFLQVGNNWETPSVSYGQQVSIVLPIINLGSEELTDLVVSPVVPTMSRNGRLSLIPPVTDSPLPKYPGILSGEIMKQVRLQEGNLPFSFQYGKM